MRRDIITLQRIVKPQIAIVANLENKDRPFIRGDQDVYFGSGADGTPGRGDDPLYSEGSDGSENPGAYGEADAWQGGWQYLSISPATG